MGRSNIDPRMVRTREQTERASVLLESLFALFRPHVEPVVAPKITALLDQPFGFDDETIANFASAVREGLDAGMFPDATTEDLEKLEKLEDEMRNPTPMSAEERAVILKEEVDEAVRRVVTAWIDCVILGLPGDVYDERELDAATVGDDMLPPLDPEIAGTFEECCAQADLTPDEARGVLRAVRAALPAGKPVPDDAVELLRIHRVILR